MKYLATLGLMAFIGLSSACQENAAVPNDIVARVNGIAITADQLELEYARTIAGADPPPAREQSQDIKLQLLSDMIGNEILRQLADEGDLTATDGEVDVQFSEFRSQYTEERFNELLQEQQATVEDVREDMRLSLTIEKLINKEITSKITVTRSEIDAFYQDNIDRFNFPESFHVAHILVTPGPDATITNRTGDDALSSEEAADKAQRLLREVQGGQDFGVVARDYSEDPSTAAGGGDLGFQALDSLAGVDSALADAVSQMRVGETYPRVVATSFGYHVLKLLDKDAGGPKDPSDPQIEAQIRQVLFNQRDQILRAAFFETIRNQADIQNYFAQRILEGTGS